jgi:hypothetical protein
MLLKLTETQLAPSSIVLKTPCAPASPAYAVPGMSEIASEAMPCVKNGVVGVQASPPFAVRWTLFHVPAYALPACAPLVARETTAVATRPVFDSTQLAAASVDLKTPTSFVPARSVVGPSTASAFGTSGSGLGVQVAPPSTVL